MRTRAEQARCKRKARGSESTDNASAKHETRGSEATENASAKHGAQRSAATKNASGKPEGAKRPSRPTGLAVFAFLCVSEHFDSIETHSLFENFCERKVRNVREQSE